MMQAMLMSVGAGSGVECAVAQTIDQSNPSIAGFLVTERSRRILAEAAKVLRQIHSNEQGALVCERADEEGLCVCISDSDAEDVTACYQAALRALSALRERGAAPSAVTVDFTGGTKPMSSGLVLAAVHSGCKSLSYVGGSTRDEAGRVKRGAGIVKAVPPLQINLELIADRLVDDFNSLRFGACRAAVDWAESRIDYSMAPRLRAARVLASFYEAWDRFDHAGADGVAKEVKEAEKTWGLDTQKNRYVVHVLAKAKQNPPDELLGDDNAELLMADIYANALRRADEGRYDDAVARLYRLTELVAQIALARDYGVSTRCVDRDFLERKGLLDAYARSVNRKGDIQLGLHQAQILDYR